MTVGRLQLALRYCAAMHEVKATVAPMDISAPRPSIIAKDIPTAITSRNEDCLRTLMIFEKVRKFSEAIDMATPRIRRIM